MEKRVFTRIPTNLQVEFFYGNELANGTITNLSEKGMFINTRMCFPVNSRFDILIPLKEKVLQLHVIVSNVMKENDFYNGMGIEVLYPRRKYSEFVDSIGALCET